MTKLVLNTSLLTIAVSILFASTVFLSGNYFKEGLDTIEAFHRHEVLDDARVGAHDIRLSVIEKHIDSIDKRLDAIPEINHKLDIIISSNFKK